MREAIVDSDGEDFAGASSKGWAGEGGVYEGCGREGFACLPDVGGGYV